MQGKDRKTKGEEMNKKICPRCHKEPTWRKKGYYWCNVCRRVVEPINEASNPNGNNQYKKEIEVISPLTDLERYNFACKIESRRKEIRMLISPLQEEFRKLSQILGRFLDKKEVMFEKQIEEWKIEEIKR